MSGGAGAANCDCSYHSSGGDGGGRRNLGSVESDEGANPAKEAKEGEDGDDDEDEDASNDSDLPVHGPMPEEPEDAPWRRREESGIRKL